MNSTELLDKFRSEMADGVAPYLWTDDDIFGYMDDAQKLFCRWTNGIGDGSTTEVVDVQVGVDTDWVDLHPAILIVRDASRDDTGRPIELLNREDMPARGLYFDGSNGIVARLILGLEDNRARVHPVSSESMTIKLLVYRLPLEPITADGDQEFEIAAEHHPHLLWWMRSRAYGKQDGETYDRKKQDEFETKFRTYCTAVKAEQDRKRHKPRAVMYGGL